MKPDERPGIASVSAVMFLYELLLIFFVSDWGPEDAEVPDGNAHLWEESWDDDDTSEDFSKQLK